MMKILAVPTTPERWAWVCHEYRTSDSTNVIETRMLDPKIFEEINAKSHSDIFHRLTSKLEEIPGQDRLLGIHTIIPTSNDENPTIRVFGNVLKHIQRFCDSEGVAEPVLGMELAWRPRGNKDPSQAHALTVNMDLSKRLRDDVELCAIGKARYSCYNIIKQYGVLCQVTDSSFSTLRPLHDVYPMDAFSTIWLSGKPTEKVGPKVVKDFQQSKSKKSNRNAGNAKNNAVPHPKVMLRPVKYANLKKNRITTIKKRCATRRSVRIVERRRRDIRILRRLRVSGKVDYYLY